MSASFCTSCHSRASPHESRQTTQCPPLRRHAVPHCAQAEGSCREAETGLPSITTLKQRITKLQTVTPHRGRAPACPLCFSGNWKAKFWKKLRLACSLRDVYNDVFGFLVRFN